MKVWRYGVDFKGSISNYRMSYNSFRSRYEYGSSQGNALNLNSLINLVIL